MTDKVLLNSGYKEFEVPFHYTHASRFYQKCIRDDKGKKYYIDVAEYHLRDSNDEEYSDFEYTLVCGRKDYYVHSTFSGMQLMTIEEIEEELESFWKAGNFNYYSLKEEE